MAHVELDLNSSVACTGDRAGYIGVLYHLTKQGHKRTQYSVNGLYQDGQVDPAELINEARIAAQLKRGTEIKPQDLIALAVHRLCIRRRHEDGNKEDTTGPRLERLASLAIVSSADDVEVIKPLNGRERNISEHGISSARRGIPGTSYIRPLIHLPVTPDEMREYPVVGVIRSLATSHAISLQPFIALHGIGEGIVERIVTPDQL